MIKTIKLMADYYCYPLWFVGPDEIGNVAPSELPISIDLQNKLTDWAKMYDKTLNEADPASSGFADFEKRLLFETIAHSLQKQLQEELGKNFMVLLKI